MIKKKKINEINDYLFKIKNDYENELSAVFEKKKIFKILIWKLI